MFTVEMKWPRGVNTMQLRRNLALLVFMNLELDCFDGTLHDVVIQLQLGLHLHVFVELELLLYIADDKVCCIREALKPITHFVAQHVVGVEEQCSDKDKRESHIFSLKHILERMHELIFYWCRIRLSSSAVRVELQQHLEE